MTEPPSMASTTPLGPAALSEVLAQMREGFQVIGFDWRYLFVNDEVCRQGRKPREALLGATMWEAYPGIEATRLFERLTRCMRDRVADDFENEFKHDDGRIGWFELRVAPIDAGISVLSLDITERRSLEVQLRQSQKMDAIGRLAGGVAHDFNNILTAIMTFSSFVAERLEDQESIADMAEVQRATQRAAELVRQLLAVSRKQAVSPRIVDLDAVIAKSTTMLARVVGAHIHIDWAPRGSLWSVRIDPGAFEQVLLNLVINARDAMPNGGRLRIETDNAALDRSHRMAKGGTVEPGEYVVVAITDQGCGMTAEAQSRLFEPFYTTKPAGEGTGLGLSTCYGIVRQAGGHIWVYSEVSKGTTFKIYLPRVHDAADRLPSKLPGPLAARSGSETILVVEDDPQVRDVVFRILTGLGYRVHVAADGDEAIALLVHVERVDLLLTDVVMPRLSGRELASRLRWAQPDLRVLYMSGYSQGAVVHHGELEPGIELIQKPFTLEGLATRVREVLDRT